MYNSETTDASIDLQFTSRHPEIVVKALKFKSHNYGGYCKLFLHLELNDRDEGFVIEWDYAQVCLTG